MAEAQFDISLVVNAHNEGRLLHPTMKSALDAIACVQEHGLSVQLLVVLDKPDTATREYCAKFLPAQATVLEVCAGDAGLARNAGVEAAAGQYIAFLDGDDLFGRNWLLAAHRLVCSDVRDLIVHPSLIIFFEGRQCTWKLLDQEDSLFSKETLLEHNLWPAPSFGRRSTYRKVPFRATQPDKGFGYEDWLFNCDSIARGVIHKVVPQTFHCLREKTWQRSRLKETIAARCIIADSDLFSLK
jgi:glycosyltransferase involved in cell wall biosynthesis